MCSQWWAPFLIFKLREDIGIDPIVYDGKMQFIFTFSWMVTFVIFWIFVIMFYINKIKDFKLFLLWAFRY